jgi:hypothetical protein
MRALILGIGTGLMLANPALAQDDKYTASFMLPYCRAAINNQSPALTLDAVLQGMCVGIVDAIDYMMSEYPAGRARIPQLPA